MPDLGNEVNPKQIDRKMTVFNLALLLKMIDRLRFGEIAGRRKKL